MRRLFYIPFCLQIIFVAISCVSEDRSECLEDDVFNIVRVYHTYTPFSYATVGMNHEEIDKIDLFVFDANGLFVDQYTDYPEKFDTDHYILVNLENAGEYRFVTWTNLRDCYDIEPDVLIKGKTSIDELYLNFNTGGTDTVRIYPHAIHYGNLESASVKLVGEEDFYINLIQNTYKINVFIEGLYYKDHFYNIVITEANGKYQFDNSFAESAELHYTNACSQDGDNLFTTSLNMMRISFDREPQFKLYDETTGVLMFQHDLVQLIKMVELAGGYIDLNNTYEFDIYLSFERVDVDVSVNGWKVIESGEQIYI